MNWIDEHEWIKIQQSLPIVCIDILPVLRSEHGVNEVGLILRNTPHEGQKWCTIGGRLRYGEPIGKGLLRQIQDTLGDELTVERFNADGDPLYVAQYSPSDHTWPDFDAMDPRKHAIGLTYSVTLTGVIRPQNEALDFRWFPIGQVPYKEMGFHQETVLSQCLKRLGK